MKTKLFLLGIAAFCITSCQQYKKGEGGILYKIHKDVDGPTLKEGDFIEVKAVQKTEADSVMYSSYDFDQPTFMPMQKSAFKGDLFSCLALMSEGDSATFKVSIDTLVKNKMPAPPIKGKYIVYTFKIEKVIPKGNLKDQDFNAQVQAYIGKERDKMKNAEAGKLSSYIKEKNFTPTVTASGLNYVITQKGSGPTAAPGDTVRANYSVYLLNGKIMDTSIPELSKKAMKLDPARKYEPIKFVVGMGQSIPGFDEGLLLFPKGTKATLILPSKLGYGEQGNQMIGPYTPLIFEVEVLDIIKGKPPVAPPPVPAPPVASAPTK